MIIENKQQAEHEVISIVLSMFDGDMTFEKIHDLNRKCIDIVHQYDLDKIYAFLSVRASRCIVLPEKLKNLTTAKG